MEIMRMCVFAFGEMFARAFLLGNVIFHVIIYLNMTAKL